MEVLRSEWRSIKTTNLGVLSGTAVVEELLLRRISAWARELHMLAITHASASERLAALCRGMSTQELQQLQVMFDVTGHPELSDYCRLVVYNTADPNAKAVVGDLRALRAASAARRSARTLYTALSRDSSVTALAAPAASSSRPHVLPYYLADVEDQWRRTVLKRGVVGAGGAADASLPASEGVFDSCIMLAEPLPPRQAPKQLMLG
eukprot:XP_001703353.1 predicted protein [Chlamydomonas reinhardtii]